jgi:pyruvate,water dikinase
MRRGTSRPLVLSLRDRHALDPSVAGGKGAGLARLARAGLPVPPGLVLTTEAFRLAAGRAPGRVPGLARALHAARRRLGRGPYAVRSSAAAEDGSGRAFAGVLDTRLGVPAGDLLRAVRAVWASAGSARARAYGARPGAVAVVVQPLLRARAAGTCFTAVPRLARTPLLVVEAVAGLGAPLVAGDLTPDRYLVDRRTGIVLEARPARQPWALVPARGGAPRRRRLDEATASAAKLPLAAVRRLARLALRLERQAGVAQDIEWVETDDGLALVQARPLPPEDHANRMRQEYR